MTAPRRILAARGGALGDFVVTLPCLAAIRAAFPQSALCLLAHPAHAALAAADGLCDETRSLESAGLAPFFAADGQPDDDWRRWIGSFDLVVSWLADPAGLFQNNVRNAGVRRFLQGPWQIAGASPAARQLAAALEPEGLAIAAPWHLLRFCRRVSADIVAIHPGSGSPRKNWPVSHWLTMLLAYHRENPSSEWLIITGEAEPPEALALPDRLRAAGIACRHSHNQPPVNLCRLLAECRLYMGHDTGISHLAAACGLTCHLLFGPTDPRVWAPPAPDVRVLLAKDLTALTPHEVLTWLASRGTPA